MLKEFEGQVAAVTGAASGIGRETAREFAAEGAAVIALDINEKGIKSLEEELAEKGHKLQAMRVDITDETDVQNCFDRIKERYGKLDVLVNCAGIISFEKFDKHDGTCWDRIINVNLRGTYFCCRMAAMIMKRQRSGSIVNISAGAAKTGGLNPSPAYVASKGGINSLTFHFAVQLAPFGVRVNAICPGPVDTPMIDAQAGLPGSKGDGKQSIIASVPLGLGFPADIAQGALFLASDKRARYITGEILDINGGLVMD